MPILLGLRHFLRNDLFSPENYGLLGLQHCRGSVLARWGRQSVGSWAVINVKVLHGRIYSLNDFSSNGLI